jgi:hypothetical protein
VPLGVWSLRAVISHQRLSQGPDIHSWVGTEEYASGRDYLLGLPRATMRRMVLFKWLRTKLFAAWKNTPRSAPAQLRSAAEFGPCKTGNQDISGTGEQAKRTNEQRAQEGVSSPCALRGAEDPKTLDAACRLRQAGHLASSLARPRWEQFIDVFELVSCNF